MTFQPSWYILSLPEAGRGAFYLNGLPISPADLFFRLCEQGNDPDIPFVEAFREWSRPAGWSQSLLDLTLPLLPCEGDSFIVLPDGQLIEVEGTPGWNRKGRPSEHLAAFELEIDTSNPDPEYIRSLIMNTYGIDPQEYAPLGGGLSIEPYSRGFYVVLTFGGTRSGHKTLHDWKYLDGGYESADNPSAQAWAEALEVFAAWMGRPEMIHEIDLSATEDAVIEYLNLARKVEVEEYGGHYLGDVKKHIR